MAIYLKALGPGRVPVNGGTGVWPEPGVWTESIVPVPCEQGWHVCTPVQMLNWLPATSNDIWIVEIDGEIIDAGGKTVAERARLVRKLDWSERTARLFACDCAERVLHRFETERPGDDRPRQAIDTARRYADGEATSEELAAARDAARDAAWDAARAAWAAWDAARVAWAARDAARVAWDAARVAWDAADAWDARAEMLLNRIGVTERQS